MESSSFGNSLALVPITFGAMLQHRPYFIALPPTEVPDYILYRQYEDPFQLPGRPSTQPKDTSLWISHPNAEKALQAAKRACRGKPGRWLGRSTIGNENAVFLVYEDGKVVERHMAGT